MAPLGSARLSLTGSAGEETYSLPITLSGGSTGSIGLTVTEQPAFCGRHVSELKELDNRQPKSEEGPSSRQADIDNALKTKEYLDRHDVPALVQQLLQDIIRDRPEKPYESMAEFFQRKAAEAAEVREEASETAPEAPQNDGLEDRLLTSLAKAHLENEAALARNEAQTAEDKLRANALTTFGA